MAFDLERLALDGTNPPSTEATEGTMGHRSPPGVEHFGTILSCAPLAHLDRIPRETTLLSEGQ